MAGPISTAYVLIKAKLDDKFGAAVNREVDAELKAIESEAERAFKGVEKAADRAVRGIEGDLSGLDAVAREVFGSVGRAGDEAADDINDRFDRLQAGLER